MTLSLLSLEDLIRSSRHALVIGGGGDVIGALVKALPVIEVHPDSARVMVDRLKQEFEPIRKLLGDERFRSFKNLAQRSARVAIRALKGAVRRADCAGQLLFRRLFLGLIKNRWYRTTAGKVCDYFKHLGQLNLELLRINFRGTTLLSTRRSKGTAHADDQRFLWYSHSDVLAGSCAVALPRSLCRARSADRPARPPRHARFFTAPGDGVSIGIGSGTPR